MIIALKINKKSWFAQNVKMDIHLTTNMNVKNAQIIAENAFLEDFLIQQA